MQDPQGPRPRTRSPFAAAFLSLLFPGLGHLYAGAPSRALGFAAAPVLLVALGAGTLLRLDRIALVGLVFSPDVLTTLFVANIVIFLYRIVAVVDSYRVTEFLNAHALRAADPPPARQRTHPLSVAGLLAVLLVKSGSHVVVARYDTIALDALTSGCIFITTGGTCAADASPAPGTTSSPDPSADATDSADPTGAGAPAASSLGTPVPQVSIPPWDGKQRLNILLIGADEQGGGHRTDTLITVSIDPITKKVAMFSLPRDTVDVPIPVGPGRSVWGSTFRQKINAFWIQNRLRSDAWPGSDRTRGYNALKTVLGNLYGLDIKYFVEVNFDGFKEVVDAVGGVTVNVQVPVVDDSFPAGVGKSLRLYIPTGIQHMNGAQALRYARSRHTSSDFDRGARQQRLLLSMRSQADPQTLVPHLPDLVAALNKTVRTDIPLDQLSRLLGLASSIDTQDIRSYVFAPPLYSRDTCNDPRGCVVLPFIDKIKQAVDSAFSADPQLEARREKLAQESGIIQVLNGTGDSNRGTRVAGYLDSHGLQTSSPRQRPPGAVPQDTTITVYNGAEARLTDTIAFLEDTFKVKVVLAADPAIRADVLITLGRGTPDLAPPPSS